jgi:hypothetical protein
MTDLDLVMTPTTFRITQKLLKDLTRAAHRHEVSRTQYVQRVLSEAVAQEHSGYDIALDIVREMIDALHPDTLEDGSPNQDLILKTALETILPQLRGDV